MEANWDLEIRIDEPFQAQVSEGWIRSSVEQTLASEIVDYPAELSLVITGDDTVHELNRLYRGIDRTTDVLAFALQEDVEDTPFPTLPDGVTHLGEVIISCPQTARQAQEQGHSLKQEVSLLAVHGVLHLLGYDHMNPEDEQVMRAREAEILAQLKEHLNE